MSTSARSSATTSSQPRSRRRIRLRISDITGIAGLLVIACLVLAAIFAPQLTSFDPELVDFNKFLQPPGTDGHILGTDTLGRDVLTRIVFGSRVTLIVGFLSVVFSALFGCTLGLIAGYFGGWLDILITRITDIQLSFPFILLALTISALFGDGLWNVTLSLAIAGWPVYVRVVRGGVLTVKEREFTTAAKSLGSGSGRILLRHILPNVIGSIVVVATLQVSQFIIAEATVSFLGFGVQPPTPAWGTMLSEGRTYLYVAWWVTVFPGLALVLTALSMNLIGDWLRDRLDPTLQN
ncbi:MAG: ABC transporter permease [Deinococcota bacterium]